MGGKTRHGRDLGAPGGLGILRPGVRVWENGGGKRYGAPRPRFGRVPSFAAEKVVAAHYEWTRHYYGLFGATAKFSTGMPYTDLGPTVVGWFKRNFPP